MRILELRAARGWSAATTAEKFLVTEVTIASWIRQVDDQGEKALIQTPEPVNKYPDFVAHIVRSLKLLCPTFGKVRIAQVLARAGLHISATTVGRMLQRGPNRTDVAVEQAQVAKKHVVTAKSPNHVWHVDLTVIPAGIGFWVPWMPFSRPQRWPFSWWLVLAVDQFSRLNVGFALFKRRPTSAQVSAILDRAIKQAGRPRHIITDRGVEFRAAFGSWCRLRGIRRRFGAVGQHGSIAIVERAIRSLKGECARRIIVPLRLDAMRRELGCYAGWYNGHRPHQALQGRTPLEVFQELTPANEAPRFEPRAHRPRRARSAAPNVPVKGVAGAQLRLFVSRVQGWPHLPVVELRRAS